MSAGVAGVPRVSVVLPVHNAAATIGRAIESVRAQDFADWELVVLDDGSDDGTADRVAEIARADPRVRLHRTAHGGVVQALVEGTTRARGDFVARLDADDEMRPDRLARQVELLERRPEIGVAGCLVEFGGDAQAARGYALHVAWINELIEPEAIALNRFIESPVAHPGVLFRRGLLSLNGGYEDRGWPEDYDLWLRWLEAGVRFAKVPRVLLRWNDRPDRLSRSDGRYRAEAFYACKCHYLARWLRRHIAPERRILLWGAGRPTRRRFAGLSAAGVRLDGMIDVDPKKTGHLVDGRPVIAPEEIPPPENCFVIGGVAVRGARGLIRARLCARGFVEGRDFIMAA